MSLPYAESELASWAGKIMELCQVCGNEIGAGSTTCRFCGSRQVPDASGTGGRRVFQLQTVNLERGMPVVEDALRHLAAAVAEAKQRNVQVLWVIHGYGSSGRGGKIRKECRKNLDYLVNRGELNGYLPGEEFNRRNGRTKTLLQRYPQLAEDKNLDQKNKGITLVVM